jgi:hypothetical protein
MGRVWSEETGENAMGVVLRFPKVWCMFLVAMGYLFGPQLLPPRFEMESGC